MSFRRRLGYSTWMRVIGKSRLTGFAKAVEADLRGSAWAACAELEELQWRGPDDAHASFPMAAVDGGRIAIELDERYCLNVEVNYELGIALIVSVRRTQPRPTGSRTKTRTRR